MIKIDVEFQLWTHVKEVLGQPSIWARYLMKHVELRLVLTFWSQNLTDLSTPASRPAVPEGGSDVKVVRCKQ
jgi:hypothetical protein